MKRIFTSYILSRAALFTGMVALIVYLLPRDHQTHLSYTEGRPWQHALLTAPFDIPVYRDSLTIQRMTDSIMRQYIPVFNRDEVPREAIQSLIAASGLSTAHRQNLSQLIDTIYTDGLMSTEGYDQLTERQAVQIMTDNLLRIVDAHRARTPMRAFEFMNLAITDPTEREWLQTSGIERYLKPNLLLDSVNNARVLESHIRPVTTAYAVIQPGERIIDRGDIVTPQLATVLDTYETMKSERLQYSAHEVFISIGGETMMAILIMTLVFTYLYIYRREIYDNLRALSAILTLQALFFIFAILAQDFTAAGVFLVPFTVVAVLIAVFFDSYTALLIYLFEIIVCTCFTGFPLEFLFIEIVAGCAAIGSMRDLSRRSQLLRTAIIVFAAYLLSYMAIEMTATATINTFSWRIAGYFAINSVLITFAYILIFVYEKLFGLISTVTLVELCDINNPLLRQLSEQCPGTFQHCMSVSNLASNAASRIGANVQLVRTGALYHDIGKSINPAFFTENQYGVNPHDTLSPEMSARVLHNHVTDGLKLAERSKLPRVVKDLIAQHHGAGKAKYFYIKYMNEHPGEAVDDALFCYPGPNPQTREASLLMMADAVEAASRSMTDHSVEAITSLVNKIVDSQVADGLHRESPVSFRDIKIAKEAFINRLRTMYHSRVAYPPSK